MTAVLFALLLAAPAARPQGGVPPPDDGARRELTDEQVRSQIDAFLGSIDTPIRQEQWKSLGARAAPVLEQIAQDHDKLPTRRARAVEGLSHVGGKGIPAFLTTLAKDEAEPSVVRMSALRGAGRLLGPHRLLAALGPVLTSAKDARVRAAAAEVLSRGAPSGGCAQIALQLAKETAEERPAFHRAAKSCKLDQ